MKTEPMQIAFSVSYMIHCRRVFWEYPYAIIISAISTVPNFVKKESGSILRGKGSG